MRYTRLGIVVVCWFVASHVLGAGWPEFRGPGGDGLAPAGLPLRWSESENVQWKTEIPHRGWSTPVTMGHQVWLTTATPDGHDFFVICVDADSGSIHFNEKLFHTDTPEPLGNNVNCYGSPSPAVEQGRVYVHFGSYGTACLDAQTCKPIWVRQDLACRHYRGPGSSVVLYKNLVILTFDGVDVQYVVALDKQTGKTVWKTDRTAHWNDLGPDGKPMTEGDLRKAYSTPLIVEYKGAAQMISAGAKAAYGYDPLTGKELWRVDHLGYSGAARPLFGHDMAYIITGFGKTELYAVRLDGQGNITDSHVAWKTARRVPRMPSPVLVNGLLYMVTENGVVSCLDAATGNEIWQEKIGGEHAASLLHSDGRIYTFSQEGQSIVFKTGRTYEALSTNTLSDGFMASPAVLDSSLVLRTKSHLYRITQPAAK